jgi:hypothetical protein
LGNKAANTVGKAAVGVLSWAVIGKTLEGWCEGIEVKNEADRVAHLFIPYHGCEFNVLFNNQLVNGSTGQAQHNAAI